MWISLLSAKVASTPLNWLFSTSIPTYRPALWTTSYRRSEPIPLPTLLLKPCAQDTYPLWFLCSLSLQFLLTVASLLALEFACLLPLLSSTMHFSVWKTMHLEWSRSLLQQVWQPEWPEIPEGPFWTPLPLTWTWDPWEPGIRSGIFDLLLCPLCLATGPDTLNIHLLN